jgi:hypothetical protein
VTTTILAVIALAAPLVPAARPEFQAQTDYSQALKVASTEKKPIVVLIGKGDSFAKMMTDANLTTDAKKLLTEKCVCLTVDVNTEAGKTLAGQFQMTDGGLVISSAGGSHQAYRQTGSVTATDLSKHTTTFANASGVPATTVTAGTPAATQTYIPSTYVPSTYVPSTYVPSTFSPQVNYYLPRSAAPNSTGFR